MASGLPDHQVEYKLTTGGILQSSGSSVIAAPGSTDLVTITDKGTIIGGYLRSYAAIATHKSDYFDVVVDAHGMNAVNFENINARGLTKMYSNFLYELLYDDTNFIYCVGLPNSVTFESSVTIRYISGAGGLTASWQLFYSLYS